MFRCVIDPGHGGVDPGAQGNGLNEKDITFKIAQLIRDYLTFNYLGVEVKMTRDYVFIELSDRAKMANDWGADFLWSYPCLLDRGKTIGRGGDWRQN
jgi:N-acetylmuramoyl-L-alanine amidase